MNSNYIVNNSQENEIDKILQDGIDKSLQFMKQLDINNTNSNYIPQYSNQSQSQSYSTSNLPNYTDNNISNIHYNSTTSLNENQNQKFLPIQPIKRNSYTQKLGKIKSKTKSKSNDKKNKIKRKINILDYQSEYNKKRDELEKYKKQLIQERIKQNKLQKELSSKYKKEEEFKKIEERNSAIERKSEDLIMKIKRSESIREEQTKLIDDLLNEYNSMIKALKNNPGVEILNKYSELELEAQKLKNEGEQKIEKRKVKKKISKKNK
jgi:hypothetical protein